MLDVLAHSMGQQLALRACNDQRVDSRFDADDPSCQVFDFFGHELPLSKIRFPPRAQSAQRLAPVGQTTARRAGGLMAAISFALHLRNADQVSADLALLDQASKACPELHQLLLDLGDLGAHLRCVHRKDLSTVAAGDLVFDLEFSNALAGALVAARAWNVDHG